MAFMLQIALVFALPLIAGDSSLPSADPVAAAPVATPSPAAATDVQPPPNAAPAPAGAASPAKAPAAATSKPEEVLIATPAEPRIDTVEQLKQVLSEVPPAFTLPPAQTNRFAACDAVRVKAYAACKAARRFLAAPADSAQKTEIEEIMKTIVQRLQPICIEYLRALLDGVPSELQGLTKEKLDMLKANVEIGIEMAEFYVSTYPQSKELSEARMYLARLLFLNCEVALKKWEDTFTQTRGVKPTLEQRTAERDAYFKRLVSILDALDQDPALSDAYKERVLKLRADAFSATGQPAKAADLYVTQITKWPASEDVKNGLAYMNATQNYLYAELMDKAEAIGRQGVAACDNTKYFPHVVDFYFKALTAVGKLEDAETLWLKLMPVFNDRANDMTRIDFERNGYRTYAEWTLFRLGYINFALLRHELAKDFFRQHLEFIKDFSSTGKPISPPLQVFGQRSKYLFDTLQTKIMTAAPELNLEKLWAGNRPFSLKDSQGKVVAIIFRTYGSSRVEPTLLYLQQQYEKYGQDAGPLAVVSVSFLKGTTNIPEQLSELEQEMKRLNLTFPAGFDPTSKRTLFTEYGVNVGSATLVFVDPLGRLAYYEQDPRPNAFGLFTRVIEGLLKG